jgi:hypothetical protein
VAKGTAVSLTASESETIAPLYGASRLALPFLPFVLVNTTLVIFEPAVTRRILESAVKASVQLTDGTADTTRTNLEDVLAKLPANE